ncbi:hypothetical protein [Sphingomonas parapaucimobilis]|uniref:hypothetical protein n=1 Tax=Sphingomonas parapaucimobilis TaxID=28213 RepID=UPI00321930CD
MMLSAAAYFTSRRSRGSSAETLPSGLRLRTRASTAPTASPPIAPPTSIPCSASPLSKIGGMAAAIVANSPGITASASIRPSRTSPTSTGNRNANADRANHSRNRIRREWPSFSALNRRYSPRSPLWNHQIPASAAIRRRAAARAGGSGITPPSPSGEGMGVGRFGKHRVRG